MAQIRDTDDGLWVIEGISEPAATNFLTEFAPWRMELSFDSGPKSSDFETYNPFNEFPLRKLRILLDKIALPASPSVLDIGFNCGYNSLYMASRYGAKTTGIDVVPKHKEVADSLTQMLGVDAEFIMQSAEEFERKNTYDLVLHLGTLYHLPNPLRSIEKTASSLKKGGWFALETVRYLKDSGCARWVYGFNGDKSNFWALGDTVVDEFFGRCGLEKPDIIFNANVAVYQGEMSRAIWLAKKK